MPVELSCGVRHQVEVVMVRGWLQSLQSLLSAQFAQTLPLYLLLAGGERSEQLTLLVYGQRAAGVPKRVI